MKLFYFLVCAAVCLEFVDGESQTNSCSTVDGETKCTEATATADLQAKHCTVEGGLNCIEAIWPPTPESSSARFKRSFDLSSLNATTHVHRRVIRGHLHSHTTTTDHPRFVLSEAQL